MSGHSGLQTIGPSMPPSVFSPPTTGFEGVSTVSTAPGAAAPTSPSDSESNPVQPQHVPAQELAQKLDTLLLAAAKRSTTAVDTKALVKAASKTHLGSAERAELKDVATKAQKTFSALAQFSGRQIASALSVDDKGAFDWKNGDPVAKALKEAIDAQADLSEKLHNLVNDPRVSHELFDSLCEMALQADRRQSEIFSLALQLADAAGKAGTDPEIVARLDAKLEDLLPRQALKMHGTDSAIQRLKDKLQPLADRLSAFAAKPNASITSEEFFAYNYAVDEAANALGHAAANGFPDGKGGRWEPDQTLFSVANKLVGNAKKVLADVRTQVGMRMARAFVEDTFRLSDNLVIVYKENLPGLSGAAPNLAKAARLRHQLYALAKQYMANPCDEIATQMHNASFEMMLISKDDLAKEIAFLSSVGFGDTDMTGKDWAELKAQFAHPKGMITQAAHLFDLMAHVDAMSPEKFLSTSSARALLEGHLEFSTLVQSRIHGMSDKDVNPALDDNHAVSSETLGSGAANTVTLVTYDNGAEYVFKPEAAGRQGMAHLTLSRDYLPWQRVADFNIATQIAADTFGLGDVMPKSTAGCHNGQFGLFMEKAPGVTGKKFTAKGTDVKTGHLTAAQVKSLPPEQYGAVVGKIIRQTNRLEWFDLLTGQGDRHSSNYLVDVRTDGSVTLKGIDNDESFPIYRTGLLEFTLNKDDAQYFDKKLDEILDKYPAKYRDEVRKRIEDENAVTRLEGGKIIVDASKFKSPELHYALRKTVGIQTAVLPDFIDADLYRTLMALKSGEDRDKYKANLSRRLPKNAVDSAMARLDGAIRHAETLMGRNRVFEAKEFEQHDVQRSLFVNALQSGPNPFMATEDGKFRLAPNDEITKLAVKGTRSIFIRDLFPFVGKPGWFA